MKRLLYPKTYATLVEIRPSRQVADQVWVFLTDGGETIEALNPGSAGHTPRRLCRKSREIFEGFSLSQKKRRTISSWRLAYQGERFKLYRKPGIDRWFYRHMGQ